MLLLLPYETAGCIIPLGRNADEFGLETFPKSWKKPFRLGWRAEYDGDTSGGTGATGRKGWKDW